jgi:hypothetical protein
VTLLKKQEVAVVITAFDENGQTSTESEKVRISRRSYVVLVNEVKFPPEDIVFDPNIHLNWYRGTCKLRCRLHQCCENYQGAVPICEARWRYVELVHWIPWYDEDS